MTDSAPYPVYATVLLLVFAGFLYSLIRYRNYRVRNIYVFRNIWIRLIFYVGMISSLLLLLYRTIKEFKIFLFAEQTVNVLFIISFLLFIALILKAGLPKALRNPISRRLLLACGIIMLVGVIVFVVSTLLEHAQ